MTRLTDYLNVETLQHLQDAFSVVSGAPIRICGTDGEPLTAPSSPSFRQDEANGPVKGTELADAAGPVMVDDQIVCRVHLEPPPGRRAQDAVTARQLRLVSLATGVIARLCQRERQLRTRVDELATLYRLTAEFTSQRDMQELLDMVAGTVVETMRAKACSIRLLNEDHSELVLKSVANLSEQYLQKGPVPLSESAIDQEALSSGQAVPISDMAGDQRVLYSAEAKREGIVSGLCAPMMYRDRPEGAIRVYMSEPHDFDWFEVSLLKAIAAEAAAAIVNARLYAEAVRSANMQRQLRLAGEVQRRMIPTGSPDAPGFDIAAIYVPCFELGGDFYDFIALPEDNLALVVCDVVGKGVRASLLTASIRASLRAHAANVYEMSEVLSSVNSDLCADTQSSDFATLFYGVLDGRACKFTYSNAGHIPPVMIRGEDVIHLDVGGSVLGIDSSLKWATQAVELRPGDVILVHTDGLNEAMNFEDEPFGMERIETAAAQAVQRGDDAEGVAKFILWEMRRFAGLQTRLDDLTVVVVRVL